MCNQAHDFTENDFLKWFEAKTNEALMKNEIRVQCFTILKLFYYNIFSNKFLIFNKINCIQTYSKNVGRK